MNKFFALCYKIQKAFGTFTLCLYFIVHFCTHEVKFGYCNDELSPRYEFVANENQQEITFGCAILIPSSRLQMLKGQKITRMRFACTKGIKKSSKLF